MKNRAKTIKLLAIVAGALIALLVISNLFDFKNRRTRSTGSTLIPGYNQSKVTSFEIKDYLDSFTIAKDGEKWMVNINDKKLPAKQEKIKGYLEELEKLNKGTVIYNNSDVTSDSKFGLDEQNRQIVTVNLGKKSYSITVGNQAQQRGTGYIKFNESNDVRQVNSTICTITDNDHIDWADTKIIPLELEDVSSLEIKGSFENLTNETYKATVAKVKNKDIYSLTDIPEDKVTNEVLVKTLIREVTNAKADEYKLEGEIGTKESLATINITNLNNEVYTLNFYKADDMDIGDYIVTNNKNQYLYLMHEDSAKKLFKTKESLLKEKPPVKTADNTSDTTSK